MVKRFDFIAGVGLNHFETLFKEDKHLFLPDIVKIAKNFSTSITEEKHDDIMAFVTIMRLRLFFLSIKMIKVWVRMGSLLSFIRFYLMLCVWTYCE